MINLIKNHIYSYEEYRRIEESSDFPHEFYLGLITAKAGGTTAHNTTVMNVATFLRGVFKKKGCKVFAETVKLVIRTKEAVFYPDVMLTCDPADLVSHREIKNPSLIVEVLSESTAMNDLHKKLNEYLQMPSLLYYLIISQTDYSVKVFEKKAKDSWSVQLVQGLDQIVILPQLKLIMPMRDIYDDVEIKTEEN